MLELPESCTIAKQLNNVIKGKKIIDVCANHSPHKLTWFAGDPNDYAELLTGKTVTDCLQIGGIVEIQTEEAAVTLSDGVGIRYFEKGEKLPDKHQLKLGFDDETTLVCRVQMYGGVCAFKQGEYDNEYYVAAKTKVSPLSDDFDLDYFMGLIDEKAAKLSAKAFLATEQRIPGLGNGVLQDILFNAGINPRTKMNDLTDEEIIEMFSSVKGTLKHMCSQGGRDTEKDIYGSIGGYKTIMSKNTYKDPCPVCGGEIVKKAYMGGSVYFCPVCQSEK